jgi:ABC-type nickel/cobalt efflux system permease component RcnA
VTVELVLVGAAISVGSIHTLAPDHWMPFAVLARAERWSARRTVVVTALCGLGHVTTSVALGALAVVSGRELFEVFGRRLEGAAGLLLVGFGVAYGMWGLHRRMRDRAHAHAHAHGIPHAHMPGLTRAFSHQPSRLRSRDERASYVEARRSADGAEAAAVCHGSVHRRLTAWSLFLLFSADPCVAVIPLMFAATPLGWTGTLAVVAAYELATMATMVVLVLPARAAMHTIRGAWADEWGDALAGGVVACVGLAVIGFGI